MINFKTDKKLETQTLYVAEQEIASVKNPLQTFDKRLMDKLPSYPDVMDYTASFDNISVKTRPENLNQFSFFDFMLANYLSNEFSLDPKTKILDLNHNNGSVVATYLLQNSKIQSAHFVDRGPDTFSTQSLSVQTYLPENSIDPIVQSSTIVAPVSDNGSAYVIKLARGLKGRQSTNVKTKKALDNNVHHYFPQTDLAIATPVFLGDFGGCTVNPLIEHLTLLKEIGETPLITVYSSKVALSMEALGDHLNYDLSIEHLKVIKDQPFLPPVSGYFGDDASDEHDIYIAKITFN